MTHKTKQCKTVVKSKGEKIYIRNMGTDTKLEIANTIADLLHNLYHINVD